KGADSFIAMIYERLILMRDLLAEDGSIYVNCDWRVSGFLRPVLDEIFHHFQNEVIWKRSTAHSDNKTYGNLHDTIFFYTKSISHILKTTTHLIRKRKLLLTTAAMVRGHQSSASGCEI
ncbi:MAG TPA: DNA methyltransferase, partial [Nitrospiria bacterium]|nr:DNA methyltransferase [Nitrospiria bacterium]